MSCFKLKPAWEVGKGIDFRYQGRSPDYMIPCGKCDGCAADKALEWAIRIYNEAQMHERNCFVTLTYKNAPPKLEKKETQDFIKRLRHHSKEPIRYFLCGEYGEKTRRPHYHAIIFGEDFLGGAYPIDDQLYTNDILNALWGNGHTSIGDLTPASACYTAGYCNKKLNDPDTFSIMSKKPPLGREWLKKHWREVVARKSIIMEGREYPVPQQYVKYLGIAELIDERREKAKEHCLAELQIKSREFAQKTRKTLKNETL